jgi:hypothetical protein
MGKAIEGAKATTKSFTRRQATVQLAFPCSFPTDRIMLSFESSFDPKGIYPNPKQNLTYQSK